MKHTGIRAPGERVKSLRCGQLREVADPDRQNRADRDSRPPSPAPQPVAWIQPLSADGVTANGGHGNGLHPSARLLSSVLHSL